MKIWSHLAGFFRGSAPIYPIYILGGVGLKPPPLTTTIMLTIACVISTGIARKLVTKHLPSEPFV